VSLPLRGKPEVTAFSAEGLSHATPAARNAARFSQRTSPEGVIGFSSAAREFSQVDQTQREKTNSVFLIRRGLSFPFFFFGAFIPVPPPYMAAFR